MFSNLNVLEIAATLLCASKLITIIIIVVIIIW